jgi:tight adherence protein C
MLDPVSLMAFISIASASFIVLSRVLPQLQLFSARRQSQYLPLMTTSRTPRVPLMGLLTTVGKILPFGRPKTDAKSNQAIYTGSRIGWTEFAGLKFLTAMGGCFIGMVILKEIGKFSPVWIIVAGVAGYAFPNLWLKSKIASRQRAIVRLLPEVIDLLALSIGAGLDFLMALNKVVNLKRFKKEPLIEELSVTLQEIKFGKRRAEALKTMAKRLELPEMSSFVRTVVQADRMGTPIAEVLAIHSEDVRMDRMIKAERMALKAPIKILFPLVLFIMPCVAIIVGAPIFIGFMQQNPFGKMGQ